MLCRVDEWRVIQEISVTMLMDIEQSLCFKEKEDLTNYLFWFFFLHDDNNLLIVVLKFEIHSA